MIPHVRNELTTSPAGPDSQAAMTGQAESAARQPESRRILADDVDAARQVGLVGRSQAHRRTLAQLRKVATADVEVLIVGPSGVGKELYARFIHQCSRRREGTFTPVNCGAIPETLFESEMFGHAAGAYTGAEVRRDGLVDSAEGGTLFLDEVDALQPTSQVKLLRFLQEKEYRRLGETRLRRADVRVVAASNADLLGAVREGWFREDLFFRLRVAPAEIPPLRERREDIEVLLDEFISRYAAAYGVAPVVLTDATRLRLQEYSWPGNVRELENCVRFLTCQQLARPVEPADLSLIPEHPPASSRLDSPPEVAQPLQSAKQELVNRFEHQYLQTALAQSDGNIARAARLSGKHRRAFFELLRKHGIDASTFRAS